MIARHAMLDGGLRRIFVDQPGFAVLILVGQHPQGQIEAQRRTSIYVFALPMADDTLMPALELAERAVRLDPGSGVAQGRLGWVLAYLERGDQAVAAFEKAIALEPDNAEVLSAFAETMNRLGRPDEALPLLDRAFEIETFMPPSWEWIRGHAFVLKRMFDEALARILPVLERLPEFVPAHVQLARLYVEMGRTKDAVSTIKTLARIAPKYRMLNARRMFPYPQAAERKRLADGLSKAGLKS